MTRKKFATTSIITSALACGLALGVLGLGGYFGGGNSIPEDTFARGLVAYYSFDEGSGQTAYNAAGTGSVNDASLGAASAEGTDDPTWAAGKVGGALEFDGSNDYVNCGNDASLNMGTGDVSIEMWAKVQTHSSRHRIVQKKSHTVGYEGYFLYIYGTVDGADSGKAYGGLDLGATSEIVKSIQTVDDNTWHYIVWTLDRDVEQRIYIDGVLDNIAIVSDSTTSIDNTGTLFISGDHIQSDIIDGSIDEVRIYNRALSAEEIRYHYNRGGPVAHWRMDESSGSTIYDATDNNNDGALNLAPSGNTATSSAWVAGKHGSALNFDGTDDYVDCGNDTSLNIGTGDFSIGFWTYIDTLSNRTFIEKRENDATLYRVLLSGNKLYASFKHGDIDVFENRRDAALSQGQWYYITVVFNRTNQYPVILYINGLDGAYDIQNFIGSQTANFNNTGSFYIGRSTYTGYEGYFNGAIDDVKIYNYARSADEIRLDYNAGFAAHFGPSAGSGQAAQCKENPASCMDLGLVGYWNFDERTGETAYDQALFTGSSSVNDGTLKNGPTWTGGIEPLSGGKSGGTALDFDGTDDYVDCGNDASLKPSTAITLENWIYHTGGSSNQFSIGQGVYGSYNYGLVWIVSTGKITFSSRLNGAWVDRALSRVIPENTWVHIVGTYDGSRAKIYYNGVLDDDNVATGSIDSDANDKIYIGYQVADNHWWNGSIDEVRIYNRALSAEEIRYHYNRGGPVAHWRMDEGASSTIHDSSERLRFDLNRSNDGHLHLGDSGNTATSSAWVAGKHGSALSFDGTDDYVDCGSDASLNITDGDHTIESWVKPTLVSGIQRIIQAGDALQWWSLYGNNGANKFEAQWDDDVVKKIVTADSSFAGADWYHLVARRSGTEYALFINGVKQSNTETVGQDFIAEENVVIGEKYNTHTENFNGIIDDVKIYNYARSAEEIRLDYNAGFAAHFGPSAGSGQAAQCPTDPGACMDLGLVGYWNFDEGAGETAYDQSLIKDNSSVNDGMLGDGTCVAGAGKCPKWTSGIAPLSGGKTGGGALSFDGTNDYVDCGNDPSLDITDAITIEAWVKIDSWIVSAGIVTKRDGSTEGDWELRLHDTTGELKWGIFDSTPTFQTEVSTNANLALNAWYHLVLVTDGTDVLMYRDGESLTVTAGGTLLSSQDAPVEIGESVMNNKYFNGTIDEVRIYNRALSAEEIRYHYNRGAPVAHWKMDEGEGSVVYNENNDLSLITDNLNGALHLGTSGNTATSSAWVAGKHGSALDFDGVDDYIDVGNVISAARTISFWVQRADTTDRDIIDLGTPEIIISSNAITSSGFTSPTYYVDGIETTSITDTDWHHITIIDTANVNANDVDIGRVGADYFYGSIDDVRIYNYARSAEQIRIDYNMGLSAHFK